MPKEPQLFKLTFETPNSPVYMTTVNVGPVLMIWFRQTWTRHPFGRCHSSPTNNEYFLTPHQRLEVRSLESVQRCGCTPNLQCQNVFATTSAVIDTQTTYEMKPVEPERIQMLEKFILPTKFWHYVRCQYNHLLLRPPA
jgi:hypothetical protein